jgi:hypothetical protein
MREGCGVRRRPVFGPQLLPGTGADAAKTIARLGRFGRIGIVIGQMTVKLDGVIELALSLGTASGVEQLPWCELR